MPREDWPEKMDGVPERIGPDAYDVDVCPGWLVRQNGVIDGAQAYSALEAGALDRFDPLGLNIVWELATIAQRSFNLYAAERQKAIAARNAPMRP